MPKRHLFSLLVMIAIGLALRLARLDLLWGDETWSWAFAIRTPFSAMWKYASVDPSPPLYYAILHFTIPIFGDSLLGMRFPSVFLGVLLVPLAYVGLRRASFHSVDALGAAVTVATSSMLIYYSQETRMYALLALFGVISIALLFQSLDQPSWRNDLLLAAAAFVLAYTHRYSYFLIAAELASLLFFRRWRTFFILLSTFGVVLLLVLFQIVDHSFTPGFSADVTTWQSLSSLVNTLNLGTVGMQDSTKLPNSTDLRFPDPFINQILPVLGLIVFVTIFLVGLRNHNKYDAIQFKYIAILSICIVIPIFLALLAGSPISPIPQWLLRGLIYIWPLYYMLASIAVSQSRFKVFWLTAIVALNLLSLFPYFMNYTRFKDLTAFEQLRSAITGKDLIVADPWYMFAFIDYYVRSETPISGFDDEIGWLDLERIKKTDENRLFSLPTPPHPDGRIYVYPKQTDVKWEALFPQSAIFVYNPGRAQWEEYEHGK